MEEVHISKKEIRIVPFADLHIGAKNFMKEEFERFIEKVNDNNTYFLFAGDILNNPLIKDLGYIFDENMSPEEGYEYVDRIFNQYHEKILGVVSGNHDWRIEKSCGLDPLYFLCQKYNIPYSKDILVLKIKLKNTSFNIVIAHTAQFSKSISGRINGFSTRLPSIFPDADIYITGHIHAPFWFKTVRFFSKTMKKQESHYISLPSWIEYYGYAAKKVLPPQSHAIIMIYLSCPKRIKVVIE